MSDFPNSPTLLKGSRPLDRAMAHEARHECVGTGHIESDLAEVTPSIFGDKQSEQFSQEDQKAILEAIRKLEATQGTATVVPTFPQSMREKPEDLPF
jgi:hypothetical protein